MGKNTAKTSIQVESSFSLIQQGALVCEWHCREFVLRESWAFALMHSQSLSMGCLKGTVNSLQVRADAQGQSSREDAGMSP